MNLILYSNFSKRRNSTKQPTGGTTYDVKLKAGCSTENPVFLIDGVNLNVTYAQWNGAYYFVDEIIVGNNNIYEVHCSIDVLATYKTLIGSSTQFIVRSASKYDKLIPDQLVSNQQIIKQTRTAITQMSTIDPSAGTYLINTFSRDGVGVYAYQSMDAIQGLLNEESYGLNPSGLLSLVQSIGMNLLDVSAYVTNVRWVPIPYSAFTGNVEPVGIGFWELAATFDTKRVSTYAVYDSGSITQPVNLYAADDYRRYDPQFSQYMLYLPGIGEVPLSALNTSHDINYTWAFDIFTGEITYLLYTYENGTYAHIGQFSGKLSVDIPYSTTHHDVTQGVVEFMTSNVNAGQALSGDYGGLAKSAVEKASNQCKILVEPQVSIYTAAGNMSLIKTRHNIEMSVKNYGSKEFALAEAGRPLCEHAQINTLSGYIRCGGASLDTPAHGGEKETLNEYLNSGFYYE